MASDSRKQDIEIRLSMGADDVLDCLKDAPHIAEIAYKLTLWIEEHGVMDIATAYAAAWTNVVGKRKRRDARELAASADAGDGA